jgi:hypothetical protein
MDPAMVTDAGSGVFAAVVAVGSTSAVPTSAMSTT